MCYYGAGWLPRGCGASPVDSPGARPLLVAWWDPQDEGHWDPPALFLENMGGRGLYEIGGCVQAGFIPCIHRLPSPHMLPLSLSLSLSLSHTHTHTLTTFVIMVIVLNRFAVLSWSLQCVQQLLDLVRHSALAAMSGHHYGLGHLGRCKNHHKQHTQH